MTDARQERMREVVAQRLGNVRCAVEAVYHRHNVSAILRTCDALGIQDVHLVQGHFLPSKGAARGAERWLTIHRHASPAEAVKALRDEGFAIWVADLSDTAVAPEAVPLEQPVCIWFGAELQGVTDEALRAADGVVTVPMHGFAQSLNVSVAAALTLRPIAERVRATGDRLPDDVQAALMARWLAREVPLEGAMIARSELELE